MRAKNLNIQDDIYDLLQQEDNASQLVNDVLRKHYANISANSKDELMRKQMKVNSEIELFRKSKELELNKIELEVKKIEHIELTNEQKKEKDNLLREEKEMYIQQIAEEELGRRLTKQEIESYFYELSNNKTNIYMFMDTLKEVKNEQ